VEFELKSISAQGIPEALEKAHRYRLLNEPSQAESICLDILHIQPANQAALTTLLLAITDQFDADGTPKRAREVLEKLTGEYERAYYAGMILERSARARMRLGIPGTGSKAYEEFAAAMDWYERAEAMRPPGNEDAILRWNTCARTLMRHPELQPERIERMAAVLDD
jgi:hypothetical protein